MNKRYASLVSLLSPLVLAGCGGGASGPASNTVDKWQGEGTHLAISGSYQGQAFDVHLQGETAGIYCNRFYAPLPGTQPDAMGKYPDTSKYYFVMKEIGAVIDLAGTPTEFTISYWRHDMAAGTNLQVVPRVFGTAIPAGQTWSDMNLFMPGGDVLAGIETAAASGTVAVKLNTGTPDSGGIYIPSGVRTGELVTISWGPQDNLNISATVDCNPAIVVTWPQTRILP